MHSINTNLTFHRHKEVLWITFHCGALIRIYVFEVVHGFIYDIHTIQDSMKHVFRFGHLRNSFYEPLSRKPPSHKCGPWQRTQSMDDKQCFALLVSKIYHNKWKFSVLVLHAFTSCNSVFTTLLTLSQLCDKFCEHFLTTLWRFWSNWRFDEYAMIQISKYVTKLP